MLFAVFIALLIVALILGLIPAIDRSEFAGMLTLAAGGGIIIGIIIGHLI